VPALFLRFGATARETSHTEVSVEVNHA
jgi:hypothetical protein